MESILNSVKKKLGITEEYTRFDDGQIIDQINSVFFTLHQLGVGPSGGFFIEDASTEWSAYIPDSFLQRAVRTYVFDKVQLAFDIPQSSAAVEAIKARIAEFEWRANVEVDPGESNG